ncbi:MAG: WG repeat-containing protein [Gammaproteobacteria bacterium]|nr:WG repeat-containing protein [Gammaproteobacteria bacterium]
MDLIRLARSSLLALLTLFFFAGCSSTQSLSCAFVPIQSKTHPYPELTEFKNCGQLDDSGKLSISDKHFKQVWFNKDGLADIRIHDGIYYINKKAKLVRTHLFDNGPDYFKEGLARTVKNNKFGFINKQLTVVIEPQYDFAFPFNNGISIVCVDCFFKPDGEHKTVEGGKWGQIDKQGNVVTEIKYSKKELESLKK